MYVYVYVYIEKATASAADLWEPRLGCVDAWMIVFVLAWWQIRHQFGMHVGCLGSPVASLGTVPESLWEHLDSTGSAMVPK